VISGSLFSRWSSSTDQSRLRSSHPAAAARHPAACQFCVSRLISVNSAALKSAAAITRCPSSTVRTLLCGGGCAATLHAPPRPDPRTPRFPPLLLRARAAAYIMPNLFVKAQQLISCRRDPLRLRQAVSFPLHSTSFHNFPLHYIPFHYTPSLFIPFHSISFHFIPFHSIPFNFIPSHSIIFHYIP
jgi:hypothetical protein